jgi:hydrogenase nickel incorporation protein HypA/HybF
MHELGIVMNVIKQVEEVAEQNQVEQVKELTMEVGEVSAIVPELFTDCFEWAKKKTKYMQDCVLDLVVLEAISYCQDCKKNFKTTQYAKQCPHCGSVNTYLITGNEINIHDIKVV